MTQAASFSGLSDRDLIAEVKRLAQAERGATAALVASLAEMDARRLYLGEGCSSLFTYCTRVLRLSEQAAYGRIETARIVRRFPIVLERLQRGELTLTNLCLLRQHLTPENCVDLLDAARHAGKRDVERLVARLSPRADAPVIIRKLPVPQAIAAAHLAIHEAATQEALATPASPASHTATAPHHEAEPVVAAREPVALATVAEIPGASTFRRPAPLAQPLAPERYKVQFTVGRETHDKLRRAQDLLRHAVPDGDPALILDRALTVLIDHLERARLAAARVPRRSARPLTPGSRHVPAAVRRAVWTRDEGRCAFEGPEGRCGETAFLEFHHLLPFARGGGATTENIQLRCRAHNQYEAVREFGGGVMFTRETPPEAGVFAST